MSDMHRLRPGRPNPLRFQGVLQHHHLAPHRQNATADPWAARQQGARRRFWITTAALVVAVAAVGAALWH